MPDYASAVAAAGKAPPSAPLLRCFSRFPLLLRPSPARLFGPAVRLHSATLLPRNTIASGGGQGGRLAPLARPFELAIKVYRACQRCWLAFGFKAFSRQAVRHRGKKISNRWDWVDKTAIGTGCDWAGVCQGLAPSSAGNTGVGNFPGRHQGLDGSIQGAG